MTNDACLDGRGRLRQHGRPVSILVIDVGTSSVRATTVDARGRLGERRAISTPPHTPSPGVTEFDPLALSEAVEKVATATLASSPPVDGVALTTQRASTVLWDRGSGEPVGPGIGWQDLRTVGLCLGLHAQGIRVAPNQSATKLRYLLDAATNLGERDLCFGTIDSWLVWRLSRGASHVTDATNAAVTGLVRDDGSDWDDGVLAALDIPRTMLPRIVDSSGVVAYATALPGAPPIAAVVGDQQASLVGQGCITPGSAKATFGTGAMLDCCVGTTRPSFSPRGEAGTFPIIAWQAGGAATWGVEAIALTAGSCVDWLRDGLGLIDSVAETDALAASVRDGGGVTFVPALGGMGTPVWDFGARGALLGLTSATTRAEVVHAVLEGIAQRGADLVEAVESDAALEIKELHVDGGMSANRTFVQLLADATRRPIACSVVLEATTLGAAFLAGSALGLWSELAEAVATIETPEVIAPRRRLDRERWFAARERALKTVPFLSTLEF
jgi:glycerol kinase